MSTVYTRNQQTGVFELVGPGGASTDTTLSISGKPADAAAVGSAFSNYATSAYVNTLINNKHVTSEEIEAALGFFPQSNTAIIPKTRGGAGKDISGFPANSVILNSAGSELSYKATSNGAFYATSANGTPVFGTLPVAQGGTGQTTAWTNGTVESLNKTTITSYQLAIFPYLNKAYIRLNLLAGRIIAADDAEYIAMPSVAATAHTALSCYNHLCFDIHCGMSSDQGIYITNCGSASMSTSVRLYIAGWYSI